MEQTDFAVDQEARQPALSQADRAYQRLEEAIVTLQLVPGTMVTETQVKQIAKLGRTPVREALLRLAQQGLIEVLPRKGIMIMPVDAIDLLGALEAREALESRVALGAAARASCSERRELMQQAGAMRQAAARGDVETYLRIDKQLDVQIAAAARNPYVTRALEPLQALMRRAWYAFDRRHDLDAAAKLHATMVEQIAGGNEAATLAAVAALMDHLRTSLRLRIAADESAANGEFDISI